MEKVTINTRVNQSSFGQPTKVLTIEHVSLGLLEKDKIRVKIEATNINPSDLLSIYGVGQYRHSH